MGSYLNELMDLGRPAADLLELIALVVRGMSDNRDLSLTAASTLASMERHGPQRITALAAAEGVSQPSMTQLVQRLELRGLVARSSDPADARVALAGITGDGRRYSRPAGRATRAGSLGCLPTCRTRTSGRLAMRSTRCCRSSATKSGQARAYSGLPRAVRGRAQSLGVSASHRQAGLHREHAYAALTVAFMRERGKAPAAARRSGRTRTPCASRTPRSASRQRAAAWSPGAGRAGRPWPCRRRA
jgi:DNA-binding MarR family transcriptional regulator